MIFLISKLLFLNSDIRQESRRTIEMGQKFWFPIKRKIEVGPPEREREREREREMKKKYLIPFTIDTSVCDIFSSSIRFSVFPVIYTLSQRSYFTLNCRPNGSDVPGLVQRCGSVGRIICNLNNPTDR